MHLFKEHFVFSKSPINVCCCFAANSCHVFKWYNLLSLLHCWLSEWSKRYRWRERTEQRKWGWCADTEVVWVYWWVIINHMPTCVMCYWRTVSFKQTVSLFHLFGMECRYIVYLCGEVEGYVTANRVWDHNMLSKETTWPQPMITAVLMWNMLSVGCCQLWPMNMKTSEIKFWLIKDTD